VNNTELLRLLRQASAELSVLASYVEDPDTVWPNLGLQVTAKAQKKLRDSIEAALAEAEPARREMTNEKLIALLREARASVCQHKERLLDCDHDHETCTCDLAAKKIVLLSSIDDALDSPVEEVHTACGNVHRDGAACILETVRLICERTAERDEARAEVGRVQLQLEGSLDRSREGAWMARALDAERELATARAEVERLRAVLAASPERPVTWESGPNGAFIQGYRRDSLQILITLSDSGRHQWSAWLDWEDAGEASSLEEAQAAAIKAVKEAW
jgi:hypothetical protein